MKRTLQGFSLTELMVSMALGGFVLLMLGRVMVSYSTESAAGLGRARRDSSYAVTSGALQKGMGTSFRFMAKASATAGQVRMTVPLANKCRDLTECTGGLSLVYVRPDRNQQGAWPVVSVTPVPVAATAIPTELNVLFSITLESVITSAIDGQLITVFSPAQAPLFMVKSRNIIPATVSTPRYVCLTVKPFVIPSEWISNVGEFGNTDFSALNGAGVQVMAAKLQIAGPLRNPVQVDRSPWSFGIRDCSVSDLGSVSCSGSDATAVDMDNLSEYSVAVSFKHPITSIAKCNSAQVFYDLGGTSTRPTCANGTDKDLEFSFATPTTALFKHTLSGEGPGDLKPSEMSLIKLDILSAFRFRFRLARPFPGKAASNNNLSREVMFHVQF